MSQLSTAIEQKAFEKSWWRDNFLTKSENLTKTSVFKDCMIDAETSVMRNNVLDILRTLCELRTTQFGFRVFVDGKRLYEKEMNFIFDNPPIIGETVNDYATRIFGDKKFGMIINRGEKFHNELSKRMAKKIQPLLQEIGTPLLGLNFTIFIGNYGWTPLGIHTDAPGESVLHHHLGPGPKTMYTWDHDTYKEIAGDNLYNNKEVTKFLPHATEHPFSEGDLYFMPPGEFHIGKSDEVSIGLTVWFNNHKKNDLARKVLRVVVDQYLDDSTDTLRPDTNALEDLSAVEPALDLYNLPPDLEQLNFKDFLKEAFKDYRYSLYSNSGYWTRPFPKEKVTKYTTEDTIILQDPFSIKYTTSINGNQLLIYIRGTKVSLDYHECLKNFIDEINKGKPIKISQLLKTLDNDWDESIGLYVIELLDKHHGIEKHS